jgi:hypothetical protein
VVTIAALGARCAVDQWNDKSEGETPPRWRNMGNSMMVWLIAKSPLILPTEYHSSGLTFVERAAPRALRRA